MSICISLWQGTGRQKAALVTIWGRHITDLLRSSLGNGSWIITSRSLWPAGMVAASLLEGTVKARVLVVVTTGMGKVTEVAVVETATPGARVKTLGAASVVLFDGVITDAFTTFGMAVRVGGVRTALADEVLISEADCMEVGTTGAGANERMLVITGVPPASVAVWLLALEDR